ncbi:hypothetical protein DENSPDRAFT_776332 [Dentipellis sp. KUC8613]|nr:hypothetical protein DENSPDRAFT_776332 [Dentipellis sp. KUC8613]
MTTALSDVQALTPTRPPEIPRDAIYTKNYCEENIYLLAQSLQNDPIVQAQWAVFPIVISNQTKTIALWSQQSRRPGEDVVVWDYHVILVLRPRVAPCSSSTPTADAMEGYEHQQSWVYDFDTTLAKPCSWSEYVSQTFDVNDVLLEQFKSLFKVIPAATYLGHFASDRSHMVKAAPGVTPDWRYISPPPTYPLLCGHRARKAGILNNLMSAFVCMTPTAQEETYGVVLDLHGFSEWCGLCREIHRP